MTNYEKYKDELIKLLVSNTFCCEEIRRIERHNSFERCPSETLNDEICRACESEIIEWLNEEAEVLEK